jgi:hypothetical protein
MRFFFEFNHLFCGWPLALSAELQSRIPDISICGLAWQRDNVFERVRAHDAPAIRPIDPLDELERKWLDTPYDQGKMKEFESLLGPGMVNRLIMSDRNISHGLVNGARPRLTNGLKDITQDHGALLRYVVGLLSYAFGRLEDLRPDMVLVGWVDNAVPFALSLACEHLGIPFAQTMHARVGQRFVIDDSKRGLLNPVRRTFMRALEDPGLLTHQTRKAREYLDRFRHCSTILETTFATGEHDEGDIVAWLPSAPERATRLLKRLVREAILRMPIALRQDRILDVIIDQVSVSLRARAALRSSTFSLCGSLPKEHFAYYPLHVDPELATTVMAPMHTDQLAVITALAMSLPMGMSLLVKEHHPMLGIRPRGFYEQIKRIPGVILVSPFENSLELIRNADLICVITGTAGWEAIQLGKPVLVIGESPYLSIGEGFVQCSDLSRLPEAMHRAFQLQPVPRERLELYIAAILEESFPFPYLLRGTAMPGDLRETYPELVSTLCDHVLRAHAELTGEIRSKSPTGLSKP